MIPPPQSLASRCSLPGRPVAFLLAVIAVAGAGCATAGRGLAPVDAASPREAWETLQEVRRSLEGAQSYSKVRASSGETSSSFRTKIAADGERLRITLVSPVGIDLATIEAASGPIIVLDHMNRTRWSGTAGELPRSLAFIDVFRQLGPRAVSSLLYALPADERVDLCPGGDRGGETICLEGGERRYEVTRGGIAAVSGSVGDVRYRFRYATGFPPSSTAVDLDLADGRSLALTIDHLDLVALDAPLGELEAGSDYRCCILPESLRQTG